MSDDIESNIYSLTTAGYPLTTGQTEETPLVAATVNAEEPPKQKKPRRHKDEQEPDYSEMVRNIYREKKVKSERSFHACDRCKIRRTRCLVGPDRYACFNCLQDGRQCFDTCPNTNETFIRGEPARMKQIITELEQKIAELEEKVAGLEEAFEVTMSNNSDLVAKTARLEEENAELQNETLRWRESLRLFGVPFWCEELF